MLTKNDLEVQITKQLPAARKGLVKLKTLTANKLTESVESRHSIKNILDRSDDPYSPFNKDSIFENEVTYDSQMFYPSRMNPQFSTLPGHTVSKALQPARTFEMPLPNKNQYQTSSNFQQSAQISVRAPSNLSNHKSPQ